MFQKAIWQNDSDEEAPADAETGGGAGDATVVIPEEDENEADAMMAATHAHGDETQEMLASTKSKLRKCGYCGIYVRVFRMEMCSLRL